MSEMCKAGLSKNEKYVKYEVNFVREIMRFLKEIDTDKSRELLVKMARPCPKKPNTSEEELYLRSITKAERKAMLYGASLPKDSETLKILRMLEPETNSESNT